MKNELAIRKSDEIQGKGQWSEFDAFVEKGISHVKNEMRFNREMRQKVGLKIIEKEVIEEESHNYKIRKVKVKNELDDFIKIQNSDATKGNYFG